MRMKVVDYHAELRTQEAASTQARVDAARAAARAELHRQRTAALRWVVEAEERVKACQLASVEGARLYDAAEEANREKAKLDKRIQDLESQLLQARKERKYWSGAAIAQSEAYQEHRARWKESKNAQRELQEAKASLATLRDDISPPVISSHAFVSEQTRAHPRPKHGLSSKTMSLAETALSSTPPQRQQKFTISTKASVSPPMLSPSEKSSIPRRTSVSIFTPTSRMQPISMRSAPLLGDTRRRLPRPVLISASTYAAKRRLSEEMEQAAKRARLAGKIKDEEYDPF